MNSKKWFLVLSALALLVLIGCTPAATPTPVAKPTIASFAASPAGINQGEQTTLSWDVSGATTIKIEPAIGSVGASGSLTLTPNATTTYTLTASNEAGDSTSSTTVNVTPVVAGQPDLVITDISLLSDQVYYKIKNQGNAVAPQSTSYLYVNDQKEASNFVDSLAPGEERTQRFSNFQWTYSSLNVNQNPEISDYVVYDVKVCANAQNPIAESNNGNDCLLQSLGPGFTYDFVQQAHLADWTSGAGELFWPMSADYETGAAYRITYSPMLVMCPQKVNQGWILGKFGVPYADPSTGYSYLRDIDIPTLAQFTSKVGFAPGVTSPDGVTVALGAYDAMGSLVFFNKMSVMSDGQMHDYNVDLSSLAGKRTQFALFVQANGSPDNTCVRWDSPKITQVSGGF